MKKYYRRLLIVVACLGTILIIALCGILILRYGFESHNDIKKNSLDYFLLLDGEIRDIANIAIIKQSDDISFTSKAQDGNAAAIDAASIMTPDLKRAKEEIETYIKSRGYVEQAERVPTHITIWTKGDVSFAIYTKKNRLEVVKSAP